MIWWIALIWLVAAVVLLVLNHGARLSRDRHEKAVREAWERLHGMTKEDHRQ